MFLIVGLGNIGEKYKNNRHNIGFRVVDSLISSLNATKQPDKNFYGELYKASQILLLKPSTFMNFSGKSVSSVKNFYKIQNMLVIHDDLDLPFGAVKFKFGGGNGGHNGLKSIDLLCGSNYYRMRYGIGRGDFGVIDWVLGDFTQEEEHKNAELITHCSKAALEIAKLESPTQLAERISTLYTLSQKSPKNLASNQNGIFKEIK